MTDITTWFQLGTIGMVGGTLAMAWAMRGVPREQYRESLMLVAVGAIAAVAYALMSFGLGTVSAADGHTVYVARYVDWMLTTPLHVVYLGLLAGASRRVLVKLGVAQGLTIALGLAGAAAAPPLKFLLFAVGGIVFAYVLYHLFQPVKEKMRERSSDAHLGLYLKLRNFIAVLWLIYPVIWLLAPSGFGVMDLETQSLVVTYIDVVAKVGFGLIALNGQTIAAYLESDDDTGSAVSAAAGD